MKNQKTDGGGIIAAKPHATRHQSRGSDAENPQIPSNESVERQIRLDANTDNENVDGRQTGISGDVGGGE